MTAQEPQAPSVCVINHNGRHYLERSLPAIEPLRDSVHEVLLVDDASTDDSVSFLEHHFPWVRVVVIHENLGPSAARNVALDAAGSDLVLFVDNDVYLPRNCIVGLTEALRDHPRAAVAMARIVYASDPHVVQFDRPSAHFIGLQSLEPKDRPVREAPTEPGEVTSLVSACFLLDRKRLGPDVAFDDRFFIYLEDHDFGFRVRAVGHEIVAVPDVVCLHGEGTADLSIRATGSFTPRRVFCMIRNRWLFVSKNYRARTLVLLAPAFVLYEAAQLVIVLKKGWWSEWWAAATWMLRHARDVSRSRRRTLAQRVLPDRELLAGGRLPFRQELARGRLERVGQALLDRCTNGWWLLVRHLI
jgi:GT2 family glycosyltransferase